MEPESDRPIDMMMKLVKKHGHITADEASDITGIPKQNCAQILGKLFRNWNVIERRIEKQDGKNVPVYYPKA